MPPERTVTFTLKMTRKASSWVASLVTQGPGGQGYRAGMCLLGVLGAERERTGGREGEEGKVLTASAGGVPSAQGCDRQWD